MDDNMFRELISKVPVVDGETIHLNGEEVHPLFTKGEVYTVICNNEGLIFLLGLDIIFNITAVLRHQLYKMDILFLHDYQA